ncbi:MAG: nitrous oxide-stimulated promoter family protein [Sphaerochaetaceae bacterium]|nr:nitrous oxide-stimulated promoter family protein [Sphaerochaetaceae bacterium]
MLNEQELKRRDKVLMSMMQIYCRAHHDTRGQLCSSCARLREYAGQKMASCTLLENSSFCSSCMVHCYAPHEREQIWTVMRFSGKWMLLYHPLMAVSHLAHSMRRRKHS